VFLGIIFILLQLLANAILLIVALLTKSVCGITEYPQQIHQAIADFLNEVSDAFKQQETANVVQNGVTANDVRRLMEMETSAG